MKTRGLIVLFVILSLLLVACGGGDTAVDEPAVEEQPAQVEEPAAEEPVAEEPVAEEPVAEEPAVEEMAEADLDGGFETFLGDMDHYNTISLDAFSELLATDPPFILDVRQPSELEENGWIEGAVNIPLRDIADNIEYLPSFDTPIVSYCSGGWRCTIALTALEAMGWQDVKGLKGGSFGGWVEAGNPIAEGAVPELVALNEANPDPATVEAIGKMLHNVPDGFGVLKAEDFNTELVDNPDLIVIDVRRADEIEANGYIDAPNLLSIPLEEFVASQFMWPEELDAPIVTYCGSGHRSTIAMTILWSYGYTDVRSLQGGFGGWVADGYPVAGAPEPTWDMDEAFATFLGGMEKYNTIGLDDFNLALAEDPPPFVIDVRKTAELEELGHIEGAVHIPLSEIADHIDLLPSFDTPIVTYCKGGWRAAIAMTTLHAMGWENVRALTGGSFTGWVDAGYPVVEGLAEEAMVLNAAEPDPAAVAAMQEMLHGMPDGFGVRTADDLFIEIGENPDLILVDVRRQDEVDENGVIETENLVHVPLEEFIAQMDMWPAEDATIVTYCGSGFRSTIAMSILWSYGYTDVHSLKGGFSGWVDAGYPVVEYAAP